MVVAVKKKLKEQYLTPRHRIKIFFEDQVRVKKGKHSLLGEEEIKRLGIFFHSSEREEFKNYETLYNEHLITQLKNSSLTYYFYQNFNLLLLIFKTSIEEFKKDVVIRQARQVSDKNKTSIRQEQKKYSERDRYIKDILEILERCLLDLKRGEILSKILGETLKVEELEYTEKKSLEEVISFLSLTDRLEYIEEDYKKEFKRIMENLNNKKLLQQSQWHLEIVNRYNHILQKTKKKERLRVFFL